MDKKILKKAITIPGGRSQVPIFIEQKWLLLNLFNLLKSSLIFYIIVL